MINKEYSFDEFDRVSFSKWKERISYDQKGIPIDSLDWSIGEGIKISPFHHSDSISDFTKRNSTFFSSPALCLNLSNCSEKNEEIHEALMNGADGVIIKALGGISFDKSLREVIPNICHLSFESDNLIELYKGYSKWLVKHSFDKSKVKGYLFDSNLPQKINVRSELSYLYDLLTLEGFLPGMRFIKVSGAAGDDNSHENQLTNLCSELVFYLEKYLDKGCEIKRIVSSLFFQVDSNDNFFLEIAKIRSLNFLSSLILKTYGLDKSLYIPIHVTAKPKDDMEQISHCTQTMSALLGGAYSVENFDNPKEKMKNRVSRNVINILKEEAYFDKPINPIEGSYFVESLTEQMIRSSWKLFLENQINGGLSTVISRADAAMNPRSNN